ncbi:MAG: lipoprotein-releasing ABC transporter permease subunit [Methylococcales bacterium]|nr:lipoprotein-releasing ABC transporter permease subunit [Methylococcales bacterium]MBT7410110.1 lipoprotein-releasing ABC transporter permease subunit [Methylococcales bacterium]
MKNLPIELFIGLKYTRAKRKNHFISFISMSSMIGIALGVTALITVLSVMNGFEKELRNRILSMTSHATLSNYTGQVDDWEMVAKKAVEHPRVMAAAPYIKKEVMLNYHRASGALVRGVLPDSEKMVSDHVKKMSEISSLKKGSYNIILGKDLAAILGATIGSKVTVLTPQASVTPAGIIPRIKRFTVSGIFDVGMYEYDRGMAFIHIADAAKLFRLGKSVNGVRLKMDDLFFARSIANEVKQSLPNVSRVRDWTLEHKNFFLAIKTEKRMMFIILVLIVAVAAFNIVSTLVMVVTDKEREIAILRSMGSSPGSIMSIFLIQGTLIGFIGTLMGIAGGVSLALNVDVIVPAIEKLFDFHAIDPSVYYISKLPSDLHLDDVIKISLVSFCLTLIATIYPARRAAKIHPAEALRYE